jgi:transcriptional regulator with XRE-family HTH domain
MLSKIENGQISPSLSTLQTLAVALNVPIALLFATFGQMSDCSYVKAGDGVIIQRRGTKAGHQYQLLGHSIEGDVIVEPYLITLTKDALPCKVCQHEGLEFVFFLSGEIEYRHDQRSYHLRSGDAMLFDGAALHGPDRLIKAPATYLSIVMYPRR